MITIHAGQCGNQLGYCILDSLYDHLAHQNNYEDMNYYYQYNEKSMAWYARSVCIDTEPKVIHECVTRANQLKKWKFNENHTHYLYGGAGNNWAMGYQMCSGDIQERSIESIRKELEDVDIPSALVILHSVGGGTGSGLGTRMTEVISDEVGPYHDRYF